MRAKPAHATALRTTRLRALLAEFIRFGAVGALALVVDVAAFAALVAAGMSVLVANPLTMALRLTVAFGFTRTVVFASREVRPISDELPLFLVVAVANLAVVEVILWLAIEAAGGSLSTFWATLVKVGAICLTLTARFAISRRWIFRAKAST